MITLRENKKKTYFFKKKGYKILLIKSLDNKNDFLLMFRRIYQLGYSKVFFETGLTFLNSLIKYIHHHLSKYDLDLFSLINIFFHE